MPDIIHWVEIKPQSKVSIRKNTLSESGFWFYDEQAGEIRNIIIMTDEDIEVLPSHRWLTLGTIKQLMKIDNLVNMDTRTVLSCIPYSQLDVSEKDNRQISEMFTDKALLSSMLAKLSHSDLVRVFRYINNYKMLHSCEKKSCLLRSWRHGNSPTAE